MADEKENQVTLNTETSVEDEKENQVTPNTETPVEDESKKTWWVEYDPETFRYVRNVRSVEQPPNATAKEPKGLENAVFNPETGEWTGDSIEEKLKKMREAAEAKQAQEQQEEQSVQEQIKNLAMIIVNGGLK